MWRITIMSIKPMKKIMLTLSSFGLIIGIIFPLFAGFFVEWIPSRKLAFRIGCLIAGYLVGMFSFYVVKFILNGIDQYFKKSLSKYLNVAHSNESQRQGDLLLNMKSDFETLLQNYSFLRDKESKRIRELTITDCLTSAYNSRYLYEYFESNVQENNTSASLLFCDIDNFKRVNDEYGHTVGDSVLKEVCATIKNCIPENSKLFRYGGEEFAILLINYTPEEVYQFAEKIRLNIMNSDSLQMFCSPNIITISIGIASYPTDASNIVSLIDKADQAMYQAKRAGKNLCTTYQPQLSVLELI